MLWVCLCGCLWELVSFVVLYAVFDWATRWRFWPSLYLPVRDTPLPDDQEPFCKSSLNVTIAYAAWAG